MHDEKQLMGIAFTLIGMVMAVNALHKLNKLDPKDVIAVPAKVTDVSEVHAIKQFDPVFATFGITMLCNELHPLNISPFNTDIPVGSEMAGSDVQRRNAPPPITVTDDPANVTDVSAEHP